VILLMAVISGVWFVFVNKRPRLYTDYDSIIKNNEITFITRNNTYSYFIDQGQKMGFEYDLAKAFADYIGVQLKVRDDFSWSDIIPALKTGKGAFAGANLSVDAENKNDLLYSNPFLTTNLHIIANRSNRSVRKLIDLSGKEITVRKGSAAIGHLKALMHDNFTFSIVEIENISTENLISMVNRNIVELTIADDNIMSMIGQHYPDIKTTSKITTGDQIGWVLHPYSFKLKARMDTFLNEIRENGVYDRIYEKYHDKPRHLNVADIVTFHSKLNENLPIYRKIIKEKAAIFGFDWRLVAAQIYQESHFNPNANSHANANGIMQLMKRTADSYGIKDIFDPAQNISAGLSHLKKLYEHFDNASGKDRMNISLAAYNVGQGHILDARNLARRKKLDPNKWESLEETLPLLSKRKYFKDSLYGYCRGKEPVEYVNNINSYYDIIKHMDIHMEISKRQEKLLAMITNTPLIENPQKTNQQNRLPIH